MLAVATGATAAGFYDPVTRQLRIPAIAVGGITYYVPNDLPLNPGVTYTELLERALDDADAVLPLLWYRVVVCCGGEVLLSGRGATPAAGPGVGRRGQ
jgi:hypothetical protein